VCVVALAARVGAAQDAFLVLAVDWPGRVAMLLLGLTLVPNAAVWGAAYGLGPGVAVGAGAVAGPFGVTGAPVPPYFPLTAPLPAHPGGGTPLTLAALAVPVAAAVVLGWYAARRPPTADDDPDPLLTPDGRRGTARTILLAALLCACAMALLAGGSGGPLGSASLSEFGPVWWRTGAATLVWVAGIGVPVGLGVREWRVWRGRRHDPGYAERPVARLTLAAPAGGIAVAPRAGGSTGAALARGATTVGSVRSVGGPVEAGAAGGTAAVGPVGDPVGTASAGGTAAVGSAGGATPVIPPASADGAASAAAPGATLAGFAGGAPPVTAPGATLATSIGGAIPAISAGGASSAHSAGRATGGTSIDGALQGTPAVAGAYPAPGTATPFGSLDSRSRWWHPLAAFNRHRTARPVPAPPPPASPYGLDAYDVLPVAGTDPWHEPGAREARWASLKQTSTGLLSDSAPDTPRPPDEAR
jgi:hypothetical protein